MYSAAGRLEGATQLTGGKSAAVSPQGPGFRARAMTGIGSSSPTGALEIGVFAAQEPHKTTTRSSSQCSCASFVRGGRVWLAGSGSSTGTLVHFIGRVFMRCFFKCGRASCLRLLSTLLPFLCRDSRRERPAAAVHGGSWERASTRSSLSWGELSLRIEASCLDNACFRCESKPAALIMSSMYRSPPATSLLKISPGFLSTSLRSLTSKLFCMVRKSSQDMWPKHRDTPEVIPSNFLRSGSKFGVRGMQK
mmetsp:Transcript_76749/g.136011  ORF Transcript_76749/g.136011 Transcript_76749/m.136011 type:complete len:250 (+) Transcript_76749:133-882(+)